MGNSKVGKFVLMAALVVATPLLLQSCSWTSSDHVSWKFTTRDASGGDHFDWQNNKWQIELTSIPTVAGVVVGKLRPDDLWGLRKGDMVISVANKPTRTVRELFADLHALKGADVAARVKRGSAELKVTLRSVDYLTVLPLPIERNVTLVTGDSGSAGSISLSASVK